MPAMNSTPLAAQIPMRDEVLVPLPTSLDAPVASQSLTISPWLVLTVLLVLLVGSTLLFYRGSFLPKKTKPALDYVDAIDKDASLNPEIPKT